MYPNTNGFSGKVLILKLLIASVVMLALAAGCSSSPSDTPEKLVLNFLQKHIPMIDSSVADFYVKEERAGIVDSVKKSVALKKKKGTFGSLSSAQYDLSNVKVDVIDEIEEFIDDEGVNFMKVAAKGNYTKTINGKSESLTEDEIIILESVAGEWKVTEQINPWN